LTGFVIGQFFASAMVSSVSVAGRVSVALTIEAGDGVELGPAGDVTAAALGLGRIAGEHAANVKLRNRTIAETLMSNPHRGRTTSSSQIHTPTRPARFRSGCHGHHPEADLAAATAPLCLDLISGR
jgi:hypothetical protein